MRGGRGGHRYRATGGPSGHAIDTRWARDIAARSPAPRAHHDLRVPASSDTGADAHPPAVRRAVRNPGGFRAAFGLVRPRADAAFRHRFGAHRFAAVIPTLAHE